MTLQSAIVEQFHRPSGILGSLAGWIMANRTSNLERNRWTVSLLRIEPGDRVLELGFGPGVAISMAAAACGPNGYTIGIDHSAVMRAQATKRNKALIEQGRVRLCLGNLADLDGLEGPFDKVFSSNVLQFQSDKVSILSSVLSLMRPGGRFATTFQPRRPGATIEDARAFATDLDHNLAKVGFVNCKTFELPLTPVPAICVLAETPVAVGQRFQAHDGG